MSEMNSSDKQPTPEEIPTFHILLTLNMLFQEFIKKKRGHTSKKATIWKEVKFHGFLSDLHVYLKVYYV